MSRTVVRLCAQPGCTVPLAISAPFRFCNKHRKPKQPEALKQLTHTPSKPTLPPKKTEQKKDTPPADVASQPVVQPMNRAKSTTKQGIDLLTRRIMRKGLSKPELK